MPSGKGQRLIILHAGGVDGWVEEEDLAFRSKTNSTDYHDEINSKHYMEWMSQQLLPQLQEPTVIILDNTSYHNKGQTADIYRQKGRYQEMVRPTPHQLQ